MLSVRVRVCMCVDLRPKKSLKRPFASCVSKRMRAQRAHFYLDFSSFDAVHRFHHKEWDYINMEFFLRELNTQIQGQGFAKAHAFLVSHFYVEKYHRTNTYVPTSFDVVHFAFEQCERVYLCTDNRSLILWRFLQQQVGEMLHLHCAIRCTLSMESHRYYSARKRLCTEVMKSFRFHPIIDLLFLYRHHPFNE